MGGKCIGEHDREMERLGTRTDVRKSDVGHEVQELLRRALKVLTSQRIVVSYYCQITFRDFSR